MIATCDYCGAGLGCEEDSPENRWYWTTAWGLRTCNDCLAQRYSDFPEMDGDARVLALRLRHANHPSTGDMVLAEIASGRVVRVPEPVGINITTAQATIDDARSVANVRSVRHDLDRAFQLHKQGQYLAAMEAGRTVWARAGVLHDMMAVSRKRSASASQPRGPRNSDIQDRVIDMGRALIATKSPQEIVGIISSRLDVSISTKTIRKYLREAAIIAPPKKKGT